MRRSLECAADACLDHNVKGYAVVVIDTDDAVYVHWDSGGRNLALIGGLELAKQKLIEDE